MGKAEELRIEELLSAIADEGPSQELLAEVESLLRSQPNLMRQYTNGMNLLVRLQQEFGAPLQLTPHEASQLVHPLPPELQRASRSGELREDRILAKQGRRWLASPSVFEKLLGDCRATLAGRFTSAAVAAGLVMAMLWASAWWSSGGHRLGVAGDNDAPPLLVQNGSLDAVGAEPLLVSDPDLMRSLMRLTKTPLPSSIAIPRAQPAGASTLTLCSGSAWISRAGHPPEQGYLIALPPGEQIEIFADAEAQTQNALSIMEVDGQGHAVRQALSFSNQSGPGSSIPHQRIGCVGEWIKSNDGAATRYFLLVGSHVLQTSSKNPSWRLSAFRVQFDRENLLVVGWDDSGYSEVPTPHYIPDLDFNDMRAVIRFSHGRSEPPARLSGVQFIPEPLPSGVPSRSFSNEQPSAASYEVRVRAGQDLLLMLSHETEEPRQVQLVDAESDRLVWDVVLTRDSHAKLGDGIWLIRNRSQADRRFSVHLRCVENRGPAEGVTHDIPFKVLSSEDASAIVGFSTAPDFLPIDVQVHLRWFTGSQLEDDPRPDTAY
jgi:hypothetical protein